MPPPADPGSPTGGVVRSGLDSSGHPREDLLSDPAWQEGYRALAEFGLSFDLLVWPAQLPQAAAIAAQVPAVPVVLEHLGLPDPTNGPGLRTWRTGVATLNSRSLREAVGVQLARQSARRCTNWFSPPCGICPMCNVQTSSPTPHGASIEYCILAPLVTKRRPRSAIVEGFAQLNDNAASLFGAPTEELRTWQ
jgi:hypothetical protein